MWRRWRDAGGGAVYTSEPRREDAESKVAGFMELHNKCQIRIIYKRWRSSMVTRPVIITTTESPLQYLDGRCFPLKCTCCPLTVEAAIVGATPTLQQGATGSYSSRLHRRQDTRTFITGQGFSY